MAASNSGLRMLQELKEGRRVPVRPLKARGAFTSISNGLYSRPNRFLSSSSSSTPNISRQTQEMQEDDDVESYQATKKAKPISPPTPYQNHPRPIHEVPDTVEELLDRHVTRNRPSTSSVLDEEEEQLARRRLTSTRREALGLYRDILRATRLFLWTDARGVPWRDVLRENARKEFEEARFEKDPEVVTRLLIGGRDAVDSALERLAEKQRIEIEKQRRG